MTKQINENYSISEDGHVFSKRGELKQFFTMNGYKFVNGGKGMKNKSVHRLLAQTFIPNPENKRCVNHKNGDKHDNRLENLEWVTHSENSRHAIEKLGAFKDRFRPVYVFDGKTKIFIRSYLSRADAGRDLGIHIGNICKVCQGAKYRKSAGGFIFSDFPPYAAIYTQKDALPVPRQECA